nr:hypothetical protein [Sphingomonas elodea]
MAVEDEWFFSHAADQTIGDLPHRIRMHVPEHDQEFVPADTRDHILRADIGRQSCSNRVKQRIPHRMVELVVGPIESVPSMATAPSRSRSATIAASSPCRFSNPVRPSWFAKKRLVASAHSVASNEFWKVSTICIAPIRKGGVIGSRQEHVAN